MASVKRLLLIRRKDVKASLINESGFGSFVKLDPIPVAPLAWAPNQGLSHYGYVLQDLKLADLEKLDEWEAKHTGATVLSFNRKEDKSEESVDEVLAKVGLGIGKLGPDGLVDKAAVKKTA